jgi:hypothetical protein
MYLSLNFDMKSHECINIWKTNALAFIAFVLVLKIVKSIEIRVKMVILGVMVL